MIVEAIFALCLFALAVALDRLSKRLGDCEQSQGKSFRLHIRLAHRNAEFCLQLKRAQQLSLQRSSRLRRRMRNLELPLNRTTIKHTTTEEQ